LRAALPAFCSLAAACVVYIMMAGALATRMSPNGVSAAVVASVIAGFLMPVGFLFPDMRVFWLEEGSAAITVPVVAGHALAIFWGIVGSVSLEWKELS
jgi:hypothetical protein